MEGAWDACWYEKRFLRFLRVYYWLARMCWRYLDAFLLLSCSICILVAM